MKNDDVPKILSMMGGKKDLAAIALILSLFLSLEFWALPGTGITWDETHYMSQSKARAYSLYARATGKPDLFFCDLEGDFMGTQFAHKCWEGRPKLGMTISGLGWASLFLFNGGQMDVIASVAAHRIPLILFSALGLLVLYLFIREGFNRRAAIFSCLTFIFIPRIFSFTKYVTLDGASMIMYIITVWFIWKGIKDWRYGLLAGPVYGIALTSKAQLYFLPIFLLIWLLVSYRDVLKKKISLIMNERKMPRIPVIFPSLVFLTPVFLFMAWPWIWIDTAKRVSWWLSYYFGGVASGGTPTTFFMGSAYVHVPWIYPAALAMASLPAPILIFAFMGGYRAVKDTISLKNRLSFLILLLSFGVLAVFTILGISYAGVQQFVHIFPFVAVLAGIGADSVLRSGFVSRLSANWRKLALALVIILLVLPGMLSILNGHTDSYFGAFVGWTGGVFHSGIFEPVWSGEPYLEAAYWLSDNAPNGSKVYVPMAHNIFNAYKYGDIGQIATRMNISTGGLGMFSFEQETVLRDDIGIISLPEWLESPGILDDADYVVLLSRFGLFESESYVNNLTRSCLENSLPVHSVMSYGAPLVRIYETPCV